MKRYFWVAGVLMVLGVALLAAGIGPPAVSVAVITVGTALVVVAERAGTRPSRGDPITGPGRGPRRSRR